MAPVMPVPQPVNLIPQPANPTQPITPINPQPINPQPIKKVDNEGSIDAMKIFLTSMQKSLNDVIDASNQNGQEISSLKQKVDHVHDNDDKAQLKSIEMKQQQLEQQIQQVQGGLNNTINGMNGMIDAINDLSHKMDGVMNILRSMGYQL